MRKPCPNVECNKGDFVFCFNGTHGDKLEHTKFYVECTACHARSPTATTPEEAERLWDEAFVREFKEGDARTCDICKRDYTGSYRAHAFVHHKKETE